MSERKLIRIPGNQKTSNLSLASPWKKSRFDPNGYYELLGLDPNVQWLMKDIKTAYHKMIFIFHPDSGEFPDVEKFDLVQVAYSVIGNPETRKKYDELGPLDIWPDKNIIAKLLQRKDIQQELKQQARRDNIAEIAKQAIDEDKPEETDYSLAYNYPVMYHFDDEDLPDIEICLEWLDLMARTFWVSGYKDEVIRVGFTDKLPHVIHERWGSVMMVNGEPDELQAVFLMTSLKNHQKSQQES